MSLMLSDLLKDPGQYLPEARMSSDEDDDRPVSPNPLSVPQLGLQRTMPTYTPMSKSLAKLADSQVLCISCISPNEFYVRIPANEARFQEMQKLLDEVCNCFSHHPSDMKPGQMIAVYSQNHGCWCRASFIGYNILPNSRGSRISILSKAKAQTVRVHLIDYGYEDFSVYLFNVKGPFEVDEKPFDLRSFPTLHDRCSLQGVAPADKSNRWSEAALALTKKLICRKLINVLVHRVESDHCRVSVVYTEATGRHFSDLAHALQYAGMARWIGPAIEVPLKDIPKYLAPKKPRKGDLFSAVVDYVVSPDRFFVTWASKEDELCAMQHLINQIYKQPEVREKHRVSVPVKGLPCITQFSEDLEYYRALVIEVLIETRQVKVRFVDYGNEEQKAMDEIFHVTEEFMEKPLFALVCSLADVRPFNTNDWSKNATDTFKDLVGDAMRLGHLSVRIQEVGSDRLHVMLNKWIATSSKSVSIADEMIENQCARKMRSDEEEDLFEKFRNVPIDSYQALTEFHSRIMKAERGIREQLIHVTVYHVVSPSDFYLQLADQKVRTVFKSMHDRLCIFMGPVKDKGNVPRDLTAEVLDFEQSDWCAYPCRDIWLRCEITAKREVEGNGIKSHVYDLIAIDAGYTFSNIPPSNVFKLPDQFKMHKPYAIHVSLADISPAGGGDWLGTAIEKVTDFVSDEEYKDNMYILLTKSLPQVRPDVLPVTLIARTKKITAALLPEKVTHHVLNDLLTGEYGVAIAARRERGQRCVQDILDDVTLSTVNPRMTKPVDVPLDENSLIYRLQAVSDYTSSEEVICVFDKPNLPSQTEFKGLVTHIDEKANVHFQLTSDQAKMDLINTKITEEMNTKTLPIMREQYLESRACTALFAFDNTWNRATICGVSKKKRLQLHFVDYGQVEEVVAENISSAVICRDVPPLALRASIHKLHYEKEKRQNVIDELRSLLVDKICSFKWENFPEEHPMSVSIRAPLPIPYDEYDEEEDSSGGADGGDELSDIMSWLLNKDLAYPVSHKGTTDY